MGWTLVETPPVLKMPIPTRVASCAKWWVWYPLLYINTVEGLVTVYWCSFLLFFELADTMSASLPVVRGVWAVCIEPLPRSIPLSTAVGAGLRHALGLWAWVARLLWVAPWGRWVWLWFRVSLVSPFRRTDTRWARSYACRRQLCGIRSWGFGGFLSVVLWSWCFPKDVWQKKE